MKKDILAIMTATVMVGGCSSDDGMQTREGRVPITLTASVGTSATTRGVQEESLIEDEKVYVWGKESTGDYDYLKAWTLTADGSDGWKSGYTPKYYPLSGETLTMVALHGNFTYTEGTSDLTATISHSVEADQSATNAYEKSDLLWASETGSSTDAANKSFDFTHKLSKIEVKLHPGEGYADISSAEVMLRGILPTIAITPSDGTLGSASGSATLIKARKTEDHLSDATPYALYEAIIPPQDAPTNFLNIKIGDKLATVAADVASFGSNKRYVYDITITEFKVNVTSSIASWGYDAGGSQVNADVTNNKIVQIGRPKLPIEYVGEYNMAASASDISGNVYVATTHHMATDNTPQTSAYFCWNTANSKFASRVSVDGYSGHYHLPTCKEWMSIIPPYYTANNESGNVKDYFPNISGSFGDRIYLGQHSAPHTGLTEEIAWGATWDGSKYVFDVDAIFYADYYCPNDGAHDYIGYGLRFKSGASQNGSYTCAYRYEYIKNDPSIGNEPSVKIMVKYVGYNQTITINTISEESWWTSSDFTLVFPICGHMGSTNRDYPSGVYDVNTVTYPYNAWYWSSTVRVSGDSSFDIALSVGAGFRGNTSSTINDIFTVRLFKDKE